MFTSKERMVTVLAHKEADRVPIDFRGTPETIKNLYAYLGVKNDEELRKRLAVDIRCVFSKYIGPALRKFADGSFADILGVIRKPVSYGTGTYNEICYYPLAEITDVKKLDDYRWPEPDWWDNSHIKEDIKGISSDNEYYIRTDPSGNDGGGIFERAWSMLGLELFLTYLITNPEIPLKVMDKITDLHIANITNTLEEAKGMVDMVYTYDDVGTQNGMMLSPDLWRKYIKPFHAKLNRAIKKYKVKIRYHSCGSIIPIIQDLIDIGVDILEPLQLRAKDMEAQRLKEQYGNKLCFQGGVDIQQTLPYGTEEEIIDTVKQLINILGEKGGYIIGPSHAIQADTSPRNIMAMYDTAQKYRY